MSKFTQNNHGGSTGVQVFSEKDRHKFKQNGAGVQIVDGVVTHTQNVYEGEVKFQRATDPNAKYVQNNYGGMSFQSPNMTTYYERK